MKKAILPIMLSFLAFGALAQNANRTTQLTKKSANDGVAMFKRTISYSLRYQFNPNICA
jgi:hypothetical protein